jgi:NAD(P)H-hydrate epimerase
MKEIDRKTICETGIPGIVLIENAAIKTVQQIEESNISIKNAKVVVICGKGNNGGDGLAISRHLYNRGAHITVIILCDRICITGDALTNLMILENMGIEILYIDKDANLQDIKNIISLSELIIDAIFGIGIKGEITGIISDLIQHINTVSGYVVSIDIPSGLNGDTGQICGVCIKADETITFAFPKVGAIIHPGAEYVGKLSVVDISIPYSIVKQENIKLDLIEKEYIEELIPLRKSDSNKGDYGKILVVAGSIGMTGAAVLTSHTAMKSGSGLVTTAVPARINDILENKMTEVMTLPLQDNNKGVLKKESINQILEAMSGGDVLVFGPGLSTKGDIIEVLNAIVQESRIPLVIDADGINALALNINILKKRNSPIIITPHPGEMARLAQIDIEGIKKNRIGIAINFAQKWGITVVLKGSRTIIADSQGYVYINPTGNPGMATAGSGDVLTGLIASFIGQGLNEKEAAIIGTYIHGLAGDKAVKRNGIHGIIASDIIEEIPFILDGVYKGRSK